jgi:hypothetical protein
MKTHNKMLVVPFVCVVLGYAAFVTWVVSVSVGYGRTLSTFEGYGVTLPGVQDFLLAVVITTSVLYPLVMLALLGASYQRVRIARYGHSKTSRVSLPTLRRIGSATKWTGYVTMLWCLVSLTVVYLWMENMVIADVSSGIAVEYVSPVWDKLSGAYNTTVDVANRIQDVLGNVTTTDGTSLLTAVDGGTNGRRRLHGVLDGILDKVPPIWNITDSVLGDSASDIIGNLTQNASQTVVDKLVTSVLPLLQTAVDKVNDTISGGACPPVCLHIDDVWFMPDTCICNTQFLAAGGAAAQSTWTALIPAAVASLFMIAVLVLMLMHTAYWNEGGSGSQDIDVERGIVAGAVGSDGAGVGAGKVKVFVAQGERDTAVRDT